MSEEFEKFILDKKLTLESVERMKPEFHKEYYARTAFFYQQEKIERLEYEYKAEINRQVIMGEKIKAQQEEIEELKSLIKEAKPWLMNNKYLPYNEIKSWLEKAERIK